MKNRTRSKGSSVAVILFLLIAIALGAFLVMKNFIFLNGHFYAKKQQVFDLTQRSIDTETFDKLEAKLPGARIIWNAPFQGTSLPSDTRELTITTLTDEGVRQLDYFDDLKTVHAEACQDSIQLGELQRRHKNCNVVYSVEIAGELYPCETQEIQLKQMTLEDAEKLEALTHLTSVDASGCYDYDVLESLAQKHPEWNLNYAIKIGSTDVSKNAESIEATGGTYDELRGAFRSMPQLKTVMLTNPEANAKELVKLRKEFPDLDLHWQMDVFGVKVQDDIEELDISGNKTTVKEAKELASHFPALKKLIMTDCGVGNEAMAKFRDSVRNKYKVVWTVYFSSKCKARTDDTTFMPIKQGEYYFKDSGKAETSKLKYLEDMECMDLGDNGALKYVEFLQYMPHLQYLILTWCDIRDISPIANCKELIYLELDNTPIPDFSSLVELTSLQDLNVGGTFASLEPLKQMTWLKNLWVSQRKGSSGYPLIEALPDTHVETGASYTAGNGWRKLPNYYAMRDLLGMHYMN